MTFVVDARFRNHMHMFGFMVHTKPVGRRNYCRARELLIRVILDYRLFFFNDDYSSHLMTLTPTLGKASDQRKANDSRLLTRKRVSRVFSELSIFG